MRAWFVFLILGACGSDAPSDSTTPCGPNGECPVGHTCDSTSRCIKQGSTSTGALTPLGTPAATGMNPLGIVFVK